MAITIIENIAAGSFLPSSNPINITVNSNNTGKCNFRYVCDLLINDLFVFRWKLFPDPATGFAFFQTADVITDYLRKSLGVSNTLGIMALPNSFVKVQFRFGEEYDNSTNCDGEVELYSNLATSNQFFSFYGAISYEDWPSYAQSEYVVNFTNKPTKFLTNKSRETFECSYIDSYTLDFLTTTTLNPTSIKITLVVTNTDGVQNYTITPVAPVVSARRFRLSCGPAQINEFYNNTIISGKTLNYKISITNLAISSLPVTEEITFKVSAPKQRRKRIGFIGLLGGLEWITFFNRDRNALEIDRKNYKKYLTSKKGNKWSYEVGDRESTTFATTVKETGVVSTFLDRNSSEWLTELWLSPDVWFNEKPISKAFRVYREDLSPTSKMLFWITDNEFKVGDTVFIFSKPNPDYNGAFTVQSSVGNIIDLGLTYDVYNLSESACGFISKREGLERIPIVPNDSFTEIKEKLERPIEYTLSYTKSVDKITLKG
jgi:hypothetical protein